MNDMNYLFLLSFKLYHHYIDSVIVKQSSVILQHVLNTTYVVLLVTMCYIFSDFNNYNWSILCNISLVFPL